MTKGDEIARMVAARFAAGETVAPLAADVGPIPQRANGCSDTCSTPQYDSDEIKLPEADTAPVAQAQNECEGSDCISYDFPMGFTGKGVPRP